MALDFEPPADELAERAFLGALLIDPSALPLVATLVREDDFSRVRHGWIYRAMLRLNEKGSACDFVSLMTQIEQDGALKAIGGSAIVVDLINQTPSSLNVETYARQIADTAQLRRLLEVAENIRKIAAKSSSPSAAVAEADALLQQVAADRNDRDTVPLRAILGKYFDDMEAQQQEAKNRPEGAGIRTGFADLDRILTGLRPGDLILIAARPAMGKSALMLNIGRNVAVNDGKRVLVFSLEMSSSQLAERLLASDASVDSQRLRLGYIDDFEWRRISEAYGVLSEAQIWLDESASPTMSDIRMRAKRAAASHGVDLVMVDYLQLIKTTSAENRTRAVGEVSHGLKALARELQVPVIALSQLSRSLESRQDKRPMLSDLRESGDLEQDADVVIFLHRDEVYDKNTDRRNIADLIVAKHRSGPIGTTPVRWFASNVRFSDLEIYRQQEP